MTVDQILSQLQRNHGHFPREAVLDAIAHRDAITPELLEVLRDVAGNPDPYTSEPDRMIHIYAMYLLAQFRATEAYPILLRISSLPDEMPFDIMGDTVTTGLANILASVSGGDASGMMSLIENEQVNPYVRAAGMSGLICLVVCGERTRDEIVDYFHHLFQTLEREPGDMWGFLASCALDLWPDERMMHELRRAWDDELIDPMMVEWGDIERDHAQGLEACLRGMRRQHGLIDDVVTEMSWWAAFYRDRDVEKKAREAEERNWSAAARMPIRRTEPKVGRNDPCPCGSGKKYKKCCGS